VKDVEITFALYNAWEVWTISVPDDATEEDIAAGTVEWDFVCLEDAGNSNMTVEEVRILPGPTPAMTDESVLDQINLILSEPEWDSGTVEDVCLLVRKVRAEIPESELPGRQ
jgi:hypothetical protein